MLGGSSNTVIRLTPTSYYTVTKRDSKNIVISKYTFLTHTLKYTFISYTYVLKS